MTNRPDLEAAIDASAELVFAVTKEMLRARHLGDIGELFATALRARKVARLVGRVGLIFPEYDNDPREVFEDKICGPWFEVLEAKFNFAAIMLEPKRTLPIFMLSQVPWKKHGESIVPSEDDAFQFLASRGATAFALAKWLKIDAREFARRFLLSVGLDVEPSLFDDYEDRYEMSRRK